MGIQSRTTAFEPSSHGFRFPNAFPGSPGLCGGMCWAALDRYFAGDPIPQRTDPPRSDEPLFEELMQRQIDSFRGGSILAKFLVWQVLRPDEGQVLNPYHSVGYLTQTQEWPLVRSKLDSGIPATLGLVREKFAADPRKNHQVVAVGYNHNTDNGDLQISIYDPNHPMMRVKIGMTFGQANSRLDARQSTGEQLRGFFFIPYDRPERVIAPAEITAVAEDLSWFSLLFNGA